MTVVDFTAGAPVAVDLDVRWIHGCPSAKRCTDPPIQVHAADPHTYVLRQSKAVQYEAPFLYLFFGNDRALLLDTGATADPVLFPLRATVDGLIAGWLAEHSRDGYELVVTHTHGHGDHVAGDAQFTDRPHTTVVPAALDSVLSRFGFTGWPAEVVRYDLGGRVLEVTGIPGHHEASIAVYDPWTGFLVTGDTVYPGRLYVRDLPAFTDSLNRLVEFAGSRPVSHVMGCHIEMRRPVAGSRPGRDYPIGATYQPDEPALPMTVAQLVAVRDAAAPLPPRPGVYRFDDFVIFNGTPVPAVVRYIVRGLLRRLRYALAR